MDEMNDPLVEGIGEITRNLMDCDRALLTVVNALVNKVKELQTRIEALEDLHRLEEHN